MNEFLELHGINPETPLANLTVGQYLLLDSQKQSKAEMPTGKREQLYGLRGIMDEFHCSRSTAQRLVAGRLHKAVRKYGRIIIVDAEKARELYDRD